MKLLRYAKARWKSALPCLLLLLLSNLYLALAIRDGALPYLVYLDVLFLVPALLWIGVDCASFIRKEREKEALLKQDILLCRNLPAFEGREVAEHDVRLLEEQLKARFEESCDLQDYVAKCCHELKLPLAAGLLMDEKIADPHLRRALRQQLERMRRQVDTLLLGCKLQSPLFDLQIKKTALADCVKTSIHDNQFFLIQEGFSLDVQVAGLTVYTDPAWLVYVLDQLIANAVKYTRSAAPMPDAPCPATRPAEGQTTSTRPAGNQTISTRPAGDQTTSTRPAEGQTAAAPPPAPCLRIRAQKEGLFTCLTVEDNGEGILEKDIRQIFNKGFTGSSHHNGSYRSTGMGLYLAAKILRQLGHTIRVESVYGSFTRFSILFAEDSYLAPGRDR